MALDDIRPMDVAQLARVPPEMIPSTKMLARTLLVSAANGPLAGETLHYGFDLVNFDYRTWHEYEWGNWVAVDALLSAAFRGVVDVQVWQTSHGYVVGDVVVSTETGLAYECLVAHTSNATSILPDVALGYWSETIVGDSYTKEDADARFINATGDTMSGPLLLFGNPTVALHAAPKQYVDSTISGSLTNYYTKSQIDTQQFGQDAAISAANTTAANANANANTRVLKSGDTMTGLLVLSGAPTADLHPATKKYTDDKNTSQDAAISASAAAAAAANTNANSRVLRAGDTMTGFLLLHADPTAQMHAATKKYVDNIAGAAGGPFLPLTGGTLTGPLTVNSTISATGIISSDASIRGINNVISRALTDTNNNAYFTMQNADGTERGALLATVGSKSIILRNRINDVTVSSLTLQATGGVTLDSGLRITGPYDGSGVASLILDAGYPTLMFFDNNVGGAYARLGISGGSGWMRIGVADATGGITTELLTINPAGTINNYVPQFADLTAETPTTVYAYTAKLKTGINAYLGRLQDAAGGERIALYSTTGNDVVLRNRNGTGTTVSHVQLNADGTMLLGVQSGLVGIPNINTSAAAANCYLNPTSGNFYRSTSARKYKERIEPLADSLDAATVIDALEPITFYPRGLTEDRAAEYVQHIGIVADDAVSVAPQLVSFSDTGEVEGFMYERLPVVLLAEMQALRKRVQKLEQTQEESA